MVGSLPDIGRVNGSTFRGKSSMARKARMITFFKNGDPFHSGTKVSIIPGKDFKSLGNLCDYLTQRTKIPNGARFIFNLQGKRVSSLGELEDGQSYVMSGSKNFQELAYGQATRMKTAHVAFRPKAAPLRQDDLMLLRPVSQGGARKRKGSGAPSGSKSLAPSLPGSREGRVITVVNKKDQTMRNRVLLNMKTLQPFEEVLGDLGQAIKMKQTKRMFTLWGQEGNVNGASDRHHVDEIFLSYVRVKFGNKYVFQNHNAITHSMHTVPDYLAKEDITRLSYPVKTLDCNPIENYWVRSFSQLKKEFRDVDTFYLDNGDSRIRPVSRVMETSKSEESLENNLRAQSTKSVRVLRTDSAPNLAALSMFRHGIRSQEGNGNLHVLPSGELLYPVATVAVIYNKLNNQQRHYTDHTEDIQCITVHRGQEIVATGQGAGPTNASQAHVRIWKVESLETIAEVGNGQLASAGLLDLAFSPGGSLLAMLEANVNCELWLWNWENESVLGRVSTENEQVLGIMFHPSEEGLMVTFGTQHLCCWKRGRDEFLEKQPINLTGQTAKTVTCVHFLSDGSMITGDSEGYLTFWVPGNENDPYTFIVEKEVKGHESCVRGLLLLPEGTLLSGGSGDKDGHIKAWDTTNELTKVAATSLPRGAGGIVALCLQYPNSDGTIYVATNMNEVYEGSAQRKFRPLIFGHAREIRAIASDPKGDGFYTAGDDKVVCKWNLHSLEWHVSVEAECLSLSVHRDAIIVAAGMNNGQVTLLSSQNGLVVSTVSITNSALNVLAFSPEGDVLAAGDQDGNVHIYQSRDQGKVLQNVGMMKGNHPILSIDWSSDGTLIQTVTSDNEFQELVLWDVPSLERKGNPTGTIDFEWYDLTSTLGHNLLGIWENQDLREVVNLTSHRSYSKQLLAAGDHEGYVRLFRYPCPSTLAYFREYKHGSAGTAVVRFLPGDKHLVSAGGTDGAMLVWRLIPVV
ncbi:echinoderm microtubule-associated protein-like CG42247 [Tachypleus tridentatus]|uniref:echinoderm microtubule-associated protein-like CG42247 n=1 Tax=Tachypleus tridentatus TaxID=6853 RepID=UPI003FD4CC92